MNISIKTIPHKDQVYTTVGDWRFDKEGNLNIFISDMGDWRMEALVAVHELVEVLICKHKNISQDSVDNFDIEFEKLREQFPEIIKDMEPGNMTSAPYYKEHQTATNIERLLASNLDVNWKDYEETVNKL